MRLFNKTFLALAGLGLAFGAVASMSTPVDTSAWSTIGGSLGLGQRDFRVFNNFTDAAANNNTANNPDFPGVTGATQAIWKGHLEWASGWYMDVGDQDPTQAKLGQGTADFDNSFQGHATSAGGANSNIHSELFDNSPGGTLAFTQTPISDGWTIKYLSAWLWRDGPGSEGSVDLQGVACHEIGHSLGLGHSGVSGATMLPAISGSGVSARSINTDDALGLRSIYGNKSVGKVHIDGISGSMGPGGTLTITGDNFTPTDNVVWFTNTANSGTATKVFGVSSTGGGTQLQVTIPAGAADGSVMVVGFFTGGSALSNEWPIDIGGAVTDPPNISFISPVSGPEGGFTALAIFGSGFNGTTSVTFGGVPAMSFTVDSATLISAVSPPGTSGNSVDVVVTDNDGSDSLNNGFTYTNNALPSISTVSPNSGPAAGGTTVTITGTNVLGVTSVTFGGVPGTGLALVDDTELTVDTPPGLGSVNVVATNSTGSDTIVGGFTYNAGGGFVNLGPSGIGGTFGEPVFTGTGDLTPGSLAGFTLSCTNAQPFTLGFLFLGFAPNTPVSPFFGGTFYPFPFLQYVIVPFDAAGALVAPGTVDVGTPPGTSVVMQFFFNDGAAVQGVSGSNGLRMDVP
jgi:hypothetical protein